MALRPLGPHTQRVGPDHMLTGGQDGQDEEMTELDEHYRDAQSAAVERQAAAFVGQQARRRVRYTSKNRIAIDVAPNDLLLEMSGRLDGAPRPHHLAPPSVPGAVNPVACARTRML